MSYGYVYRLIPGTPVAPGARVLFDTAGPLSGVTYTPGSSVINVVAAGTYYITFSTSVAESSQFALWVNGAPEPSTVYGSGAGTQQNVGSCILVLPAGAGIELYNYTSAAACGFPPTEGGSEINVGASVTIMQLA
jgi:hypothetical protein